MPAVPGIDFQDDRGDRARPLQQDRLLEMFERALRLLGLGAGVELAAVQERAEEAHDAAVGVVVRPAARVAGHVDRGVGAAVIRAVARQHLVAAGVQPGHPHRVLVGVGAAVGEEHLVQLTGGALGDQPRRLRAGVVDVLRRDGAQLGGLGLDGGDDFRVLVADVGVHQLGGEVQQPVAVAVPHIGTRRRGDRHRVDLGLRGPGVEDVLAVELVGPPRLAAGLVELEPVRQDPDVGVDGHRR